MTLPTLPLGGAGRDFPFTEDETLRDFSYLTGTVRRQALMEDNIIQRNSFSILGILLVCFGMGIIGEPV